MILHDEFYYKVRIKLLNRIKPLNKLATELNLPVQDVTDFIAVASNAQIEGNKIFEARYHMFLRGLEGIFITLKPSNKLFVTRWKHDKQDPFSNDCANKPYEVLFIIIPTHLSIEILGKAHTWPQSYAP